MICLRMIRDRLSALRMAWKALTVPSDPPKAPGHFLTHTVARAWLADARGMWHNAGKP